MVIVPSMIGGIIFVSPFSYNTDENAKTKTSDTVARSNREKRDESPPTQSKNPSRLSSDASSISSA